MSTLKVSNINNESATSGGIQIDSSGAISGALPYPNRNLLYNGAMQVAQRGTSVTGITTQGYYTADRWQTIITNLGTWTQSIDADGPSGSGFTKSIKMLCTAADSSPASDDLLFLTQILEGQDLQRISKGTGSAQQLTISFWVKSNVTGTYIVSLYDNDNARFVSAAYTISASATWEKKIIKLPADTSGAFDNNNAASLYVSFYLASGSNRTSGTLNTVWASWVEANAAVGQTNLAAATNNYWQITGVQLEVGDTATEFEFKSYGQELAECQRYYQKLLANAAATGTAGSSFGTHVIFPVSMRTSPNVTQITNNAQYTQINVTASTSNYSGNNTGVLVYRSPSTTGATQFSEIFSASAEL